MLILAAFWYILKGCKIVARKRCQRHVFVQIAQEKAGNPKISGRFLVEVTGFEPATFWSRTTISLSDTAMIYPTTPAFKRISSDRKLSYA